LNRLKQYPDQYVSAITVGAEKAIYEGTKHGDTAVLIQSEV